MEPMARVKAVMPGASGSTGRVRWTILTIASQYALLAMRVQVDRRVDQHEEMQAVAARTDLGVSQQGVPLEHRLDLSKERGRILRRGKDGVVGADQVRIQVQHETTQGGDPLERHLDLPGLAPAAAVIEGLSHVDLAAVVGRTWGNGWDSVGGRGRRFRARADVDFRAVHAVR